MSTLIQRRQYSDKLQKSRNSLTFRNPEMYSIKEINGHTDQDAGIILSINRKTGKGKQIIKADNKTFLCIIPLGSPVRCNTEGKESYHIQKTDLFIMVLEKGAECELLNASGFSPLHYLQITMKCDESVFLTPDIFFFNTEQSLSGNRINPVFSCGNLSILYSFRKISIGKFNTGNSVLYKTKNKNLSKCLMYVLKGEYQVEDTRLLQGQSLSVWDTEEIFVEALCDDAVIFFLEYNGLPDSKLAAVK